MKVIFATMSDRFIIRFTQTCVGLIQRKGGEVELWLPEMC